MAYLYVVERVNSCWNGLRRISHIQDTNRAVPQYELFDVVWAAFFWRSFFRMSDKRAV